MSKAWDVGAVAGSRILRQVVLVIVMAIAARVLGKELLGVWALIYIVLHFGVLLSDSGISTFVVRQKDLDRRMYGTAFYLSTGLALLISAIVAAIGVPLATVLGYREYSVHFMVASLAIIPLTMNGLLQSKLRRDRRFNRMLAADACANLLLLGGAVWMLAVGAELWAFIIPTIVAPLAGILVCASAVGIPAFKLDRGNVKTIADYSLGLVGFCSVNYWARNADHVLIGRFLGAAPLGVYSFAYKIMVLPLSQINVTAHTVALPYLAPHQDDPKKLCESMRGLTVVVGMLTTLPMIWIWLERDFLIDLVLGQQWSGVADLLLVLAPLGILQTLVNPIGLCFQVSGKTKRFFVVGLVHTFAIVLSFVIGVWLGTLQWVVTCYAIANLIMVPISVGTGLHTIGGHLRDWLLWCSPFFGCLVACWHVHQWLPSIDSDWMQLMATLVVTCLTALPFYWYAFRTTFGGEVLFGNRKAEYPPAQSHVNESS